MQDTGVTASRGAFLAVDDPNLDAGFAEQDGHQEARRARPHYQYFCFVVSHDRNSLGSSSTTTPPGLRFGLIFISSPSTFGARSSVNHPRLKSELPLSASTWSHRKFDSSHQLAIYSHFLPCGFACSIAAEPPAARKGESL